MKLLALSGSLRKQSYNTAANQALQTISPNNIEILLFQNMANIPLFNPDIEENTPPAIAELKALIAACDGLIISSPEYAHGITGVMKNTLDWLVSGEEFIDKPVMFINTSPRASHAQESLREIVNTMSGNISDEACLSIPLLGSALDAKGITQTPELTTPLKTSLKVFQTFINNTSNKISK